MTQKEQIASLVSDVEALKSAIASLQKPVSAPEVPEVTPVKVPEYPVSPEYVDIVDLTFNKSFGVRVEPMPDTSSFLFTIVVPKQYSKVTIGEDLRAKVITHSDGVGGVRLWAEKVFNYFDKETQDRIVSDRSFVERTI